MLFMVLLRSTAGMPLPPEPASASPLSSDAACERSRRKARAVDMPGHPTARLRRVRGQDALAPKRPTRSQLSKHQRIARFVPCVFAARRGRRVADAQGTRTGSLTLGRASGGKAFCLPSRRQARWLRLRRKGALRRQGRQNAFPPEEDHFHGASTRCGICFHVRNRICKASIMPTRTVERRSRRRVFASALRRAMPASAAAGPC